MSEIAAVEINSFNKLRLIYSQYVLNASSDNRKILVIYLKVSNMSRASWKYAYILVYSGMYSGVFLCIPVYFGVFRCLVEPLSGLIAQIMKLVEFYTINKNNVFFCAAGANDKIYILATFINLSSGMR